MNYHNLSATTKDEKAKVRCHRSVVRWKKQLTTDNFHKKVSHAVILYTAINCVFVSSEPLFPLSLAGVME